MSRRLSRRSKSSFNLRETQQRIAETTRKGMEKYRESLNNPQLDLEPKKEEVE